jgi:hypothetical protein
VHSIRGVGDETINGGNYRVRGFETSGSASLVSGLTVEFGAAWNHSALVKQPTFYWADGTPINFNSLQNSAQVTLTNPVGAAWQSARRGATVPGQHPLAL